MSNELAGIHGDHRPTGVKPVVAFVLAQSYLTAQSQSHRRKAGGDSSKLRAGFHLCWGKGCGGDIYESCRVSFIQG